MATTAEVSRAYAPGIACLATTKLVDLLKAGEIGDVIDDARLREVSGKDCRVTGDGYGNLGTAIRIVARNHGRVWKRIPKEGCIKCLNVQEGVEREASGLRSQSRASKRSVERLCVLAKSADRDEMVTVNAMVAQQGTLAVLASSRQTKKLVAHRIHEPTDMNKLLVALQAAQAG